MNASASLAWVQAAGPSQRVEARSSPPIWRELADLAPLPMNRGGQQDHAASSVPPQLSFSEAELARACAAAAAAVRAECADEAARRAAAQEQAETGRLVNLLESSLRQRTSEQQAVREQAMQIGVSLARVMAGKALGHDPIAAAGELLDELLPTLKVDAGLILAVRGEDAEALKARLAALGAATGFRGAVEVRAEPELARGDLRIRWDDGWAERSLHDLERRAAAALDGLMTAGEGAGARASEHGVTA